MELTREQIEAMPAGREMDALVAEHVMGWQRHVSPPDIDGDHGGVEFLMGPGCTLDNMRDYLPRRGPINFYGGRHYSTDIAAAWTVAEKFRKFTIEVRGSENGWVCALEGYTALAGSVSLAICVAALLWALEETP